MGESIKLFCVQSLLIRSIDFRSSIERTSDTETIYRNRYNTSIDQYTGMIRELGLDLLTVLMF